MILPSKHLPEQRALISVGAEILLQLKRPLDVSDLWEKVRDAHHSGNADDNLSFDWFTLALTFLFAVTAVEMSDGLITTAAMRDQNDPLD